MDFCPQRFVTFPRRAANTGEGGPQWSVLKSNKRSNSNTHSPNRPESHRHCHNRPWSGSADSVPDPRASPVPGNTRGRKRNGAAQRLVMIPRFNGIRRAIPRKAEIPAASHARLQSDQRIGHFESRTRRCAHTAFFQLVAQPAVLGSITRV